MEKMFPMTDQATTDRRGKEADMVCVGFGPALDMRSQIATARNQLPHPQEFAFYNPVTTT